MKAKPARSGQSPRSPGPRSTTTRRPARSSRNVFVIHGRDEHFREKLFELLRAVDLHPMEWEKLVSLTRHTAPPLLTVVQTAIRNAQAIVVLLTPDDIVKLHPSLYIQQESDGKAAMQPRPSVLIELGMALASCAERTIIVEVGELRPVADLGGVNVVRFDGTEGAIGKLIQRLKNAGCPVDDSGTDWRNRRRFVDIESYRRGPF